VIRDPVALYADNGSPLKGSTMLVTLQKPGVAQSFNRLSASDDNPYYESLFSTLKYRLEYPERSFSSLATAREWGEGFTHWYNSEHLDNAIGFSRQRNLLRIMILKY
jgi:transposase InsO family protein